MIAVQSIGVFTLDAVGVISLSSSAFPWLATVLGAFLFGFAISLAGGCATGTYYRAGEGLVGSWLALIFYALFSAISKTGVLATGVSGLRGVTVEASTVHGLLGVSPWFLIAVLDTAVVLLARHHLRKRPALAWPPCRPANAASPTSSSRSSGARSGPRSGLPRWRFWPGR